MKFFSKNEAIGILIILLVISGVSFRNFGLSLRRARDAQRRADVGTIVNALDKFHTDFGYFPESTSNGEIKACKPDNFGALKDKLENDKNFLFTDYLHELKGCVWGKDSLQDLLDPAYPAYLEVISGDPSFEDGYSYYYLSDLTRFQLYSYLEGGKDEAGFNEGIVIRNLACGKGICNFGKAYGETPLDKSLKEYENELIQKNSPN